MRKVVAVFLALPMLMFPLAALADEESNETGEQEAQEQVIGPQVLSPSGYEPKSEPIDVSEIVITRQTPADQFVLATANPASRPTAPKSNLGVLLCGKNTANK